MSPGSRVQLMVFIYVGSSEHVAHVDLFRKKIGFVHPLDVTKCLKQVKIPDLLHRRA